MPSIYDYIRANEELLSFREGEYLALDKIEFWLLKYANFFKRNEYEHSCSNYTLPCFCCRRKQDCFFVELYREMIEVSAMGRNDRYYHNELANYYSLKEDKNKLREWLRRNLDKQSFGLPYCSPGQYLDVQISINTGKVDGEYFPLTIKIKGENFKNSYDFDKVYDELFFTKKILPEEYELWAVESGYNEFINGADD